MSSIQTAEELSKILNDYYNSMGHIYPDIERLKNLLSEVSDAQRYELLSSIRGDIALIEAAPLGKTELCVTLLSVLPQADKLKLIPFDELRAFHFAALWRYTETISGILNCLTAEQQLQLLFTQDSDGDTALHDAARMGHTETVKTLLDNLTPEQQLKLLFTWNLYGNTALHDAAQQGHTGAVKSLLDILTPEQQLKLLSVRNHKDMTASEEPAGYYEFPVTMRTMEHYQNEANYRVYYCKFAIFT